MFRDRDDAGGRLGALVRERVAPPIVVLGVPRGGVIVAKHVAAALVAPLDVVVPRKLGAPGNAELGIGAVAPGVIVVNDELVDRLDVPASYIEWEAARQQEEVRRRTRLYRGDRPAPQLEGTTVVIVDDGVATGGTVLASIGWARAQHAAHVVLAVPVLPAAMVRRLQEEADQVVSLAAPHLFGSVGEWYERFPQVADEEVRVALAEEG